MTVMRIFMAGFLAGCTWLDAATYWEESSAAVDEAVADTNTAATRLVPLAAQVPFQDFRYPHVDNLENVTFIVDQAPNHGIYRSFAMGRSLLPLVQSGTTTLPSGGAVADYLRGLQMDGAEFIFNATDSQNQRGLYFWRNGKLQTIARTRETVLPGDDQVLTDVEYGSLAGGNVFYTAETPAGMALVMQNVDIGANRVLLKTGVAIPGRSDAAFEYFSPQNWTDGESVVFRAARVADPHAKRESPDGVRGLYGWFRQMPADPGAFALDSLRTIADWTTPIPGMAGKTFTDFRSAPVKQGLVAFVGSGTDCEGVYIANSNAADSTPRVIVDTETRLPILGGKFTGFGIFPTICGDSVVFTGRSGDFEGVFLYSPSTDALFVLADNRTPVDGKAVKGFEIAGHFMVRNRFAITANFEDGTSGVYLATIPTDGFTRMGAPGL